MSSIFDAEFISEALMLTNKAGVHSKAIALIVCDEDVDSKTKLHKLKMSILKYKSSPTEKMNIDKSELDKYENLMNFSNDTDTLEHVNDIIKILHSPAKEHSALLKNIGQVISNKDLADDDKVDMIGDLLISA